jgi:hypothetical protein
MSTRRKCITGTASLMAGKHQSKSQIPNPKSQTNPNSQTPGLKRLEFGASQLGAGLGFGA